MAVPRPSLDGSRSGSAFGQSSTNTVSAPKSFKKIFRSSIQGTLRATGLARGRDKDKDKDRENNTNNDGGADEHGALNGRSSSSRQFSISKPFARRSQQPQTQPPTATSPDSAIPGFAPFVSPSIRGASMSSPNLSLSRPQHPFQFPATAEPLRPGPASKQRGSHHHHHQHQPSTTTTATGRTSFSRERDAGGTPRNSSSISRPYALIPTSPSTPTLVQAPDMPTRRTSTSRNPRDRSITPTTHRNPQPRSPPPTRIMRVPSASASTSHLPTTSTSTSTATATATATRRASNASPSYHHRNTSSVSISASANPYQDAIRKASQLLCKELARCPQHITRQDWELADARLQALKRFTQIWSFSPDASSPVSATNEEKGRRYFKEAIRDGYVLCILMNKFKPNAIMLISTRDNGGRNITSFLAAARHLGLSDDDIFNRDDIQEASTESLARVADTIIALCNLAATASRQQPKKGPYSSSHWDGAVSTPNLATSRTVSPALTGKRAPQQLTPEPSSSSRPRRSMDTPRDRDRDGAASPSLPPKSPMRPNLARASFTSSLTDSTHANSSLLDNRTSTRYDTVTTKATSILPTSKDVFSSEEYQTPLTDLPPTTRRQSFDRERERKLAAAAGPGLPSSPPLPLLPLLPSTSLDMMGGPRRRERKSIELGPNDLSNVEEVDEGTRRGRPVGISSIPVTFDSSSNSDSPAPISPLRRPSLVAAKRSSLDQRGSNNNNSYLPKGLRSGDGDNGNRMPPQAIEVNLSTTPPPPPKAALPVKRPTHGHRHSVDTVVAQPLAPRWPASSSSYRNNNNDRESSPSSSRDSSTPSPNFAGSAVHSPPIVRRPSRSSYVPKNQIVDTTYSHSPNEATSGPPPGATRVPFPRSVSGDQTANLSRLSALPASSDTLTQLDARNPSSPRFRPRHNSELELPKRRSRPISIDDAGGMIRSRMRHGSMVSLGTPSDLYAKDSAFIETVTVKEEGEPDRTYRLGNLLGRGQFGSVYRAFNVDDGQTVAIKRIDLQGLPEDEIAKLMSEVDLLQSLSHSSIVKYEGMVRGPDTLSIVLEYVENGSLGQTLKTFGKLNERLVASYVAKILDGLHYLHNNNVVHCDLKAANILTTKKGNVKLSDFGVSYKLQKKAIQDFNDDKLHEHVAGTPNWMAPEIIQLHGPSTASDIWSLGCTAIELLTGQPPYSDLGTGMSVLYRIVEDPEPPIPSICSEPMRDFLTQCLQKNPSDRPNAQKLFEHPWLKQAMGEHRVIRPIDSHPFLPKMSSEGHRSDGKRTLSIDTRSGTGGPSESPNVGSSPLTPTATSPDSAEPPPRAHSFVKTTFGKAVMCKVCYNQVKRSAVLCEDCSLIAHARCAADAPATCDLRYQLSLYAHYSQASHAQTHELAAPPGLLHSSLAAPLPMPSTPLSPPSRRSFDIPYSESPPKFGKMLNWIKSKSPEPGYTAPSTPREMAGTPTPAPRRPDLAVNPRHLSNNLRVDSSDARTRSALSVNTNTTGHSDSIRSMATATETVSDSLGSRHQQPVVQIVPTHREHPHTTTTRTTRTVNPIGTSQATTRDRRHGSRISTGVDISEHGEDGRRRIRRSHPQSHGSHNSSADRSSSQCVIQ